MDFEVLQSDYNLIPYTNIIKKRYRKITKKKEELLDRCDTLADFANGHMYFGLHKTENYYIFREWAPNAKKIFLIGTFNQWKENRRYAFKKISNGNWELKISTSAIKHKDLYRLIIHWKRGKGSRIPAYAKRVQQDINTKNFNAQVWFPENQYAWTNKQPKGKFLPFIYEVHVGMAGEKEEISTYKEFTRNILPRILKAGYNCLQLMAIMEHPYYGSFGYHVSNFFAPSSRFGTPEQLKELIDVAHKFGIRVIMDIVHSHSVKNTMEGLAEYDGTTYQFFHKDKKKREHSAWDSLCFDYGKNEVIHFLLSNVKYWMEEFKIDGFRFDGVTSMIYYDHGLERNFSHYDTYFDGSQDEDAITYLTLTNQLIHEINPYAISIAEDMSGMPGLAVPIEKGGYGFDYRMSMGVPDYWIRLLKDTKDEEWKIGQIFYELTNKRLEEKVISYAESHDQALVGDKTLLFRMIEKKMYDKMSLHDNDLDVARGIALHKMIRLITCGLAGGGYLNFMGNEFGHPEWIDFPRQGNNWSYKYARRQWSLVDANYLKYHLLANFDRDMIHLMRDKTILENEYIEKLVANDNDFILAFQRGSFLFVFNFHPNKSFTNYGIKSPKGRYKIIFCSDKAEYGGNNLLDTSLMYYTQAVYHNTHIQQLLLYIPARTAIILEKQKIKSIY